MKIADLKQPYRRMAEYLAEKNTYTRFKNKEILNDAFDWYQTNVIFWLDIADGDYPPITEEIKKHFPPDFDFSGDEKVLTLSLNEIAIRLFGKEFNYLETYEKEQVVTSQENKLEFLTKKQNMSLFDKENQRKIEDENLQKRIYTQLAREGKFEQLPDTCEFSEPVELEVCDGGTINQIAKVIGKFKGKFVEKEDISRNGYTFWNFAQLPTPKIDFSEFKSGDVVEIDYASDDFKSMIIGYIYTIDKKSINLTIIKEQLGRTILKKEIKSITKIK